MKEQRAAFRRDGIARSRNERCLTDGCRSYGGTSIRPYAGRDGGSGTSYRSRVKYC
ncbi:hypothetical protein BGW80DRAFT_1355574, partial [Lactifluus volemus]